jgi:CheY-like chemotaxis protein
VENSKEMEWPCAKGVTDKCDRLRREYGFKRDALHMPKILIADDSRFQVTLLTMALQERGYEVLAAQDACQAGMVALRTAPDAIILDINMPGGSGIEVLKRLKRSIKTQRIPVVVVSGSGDSNVRQLLLELGVAHFLAKPVNLDELCSALSSLLSMGESSYPALKT